MAERYQQQFARNVREVVTKRDGRSVTRIRFRGILKYREENPLFVERVDGARDTRTDTQRRRYVWKQVGKELECAKGRSKKQTEKNISDALSDWREQMEKEAATPHEARRTAVDFINEFVAHKRNARDGQELARTTKDTYQFALRLIDRPPLQKPLKDIEPKHVSEWLGILRGEGRGESAITKAYRIVKQAFDSAVRLGYVDANPCDRISVDEGKPVVKAAKVNAMNREQLARCNALLDGLGHTQMADCARMALLCGMRLGEVCGLRLKSIDGWRTGDYGDLHVREVISRTSEGEELKGCPKSGMERAIHINAPMAELISVRIGMLREQAKSIGMVLGEDEFLFGTFTGGDGAGFMRTNNLSKQWAMFAKACDIVGDKGLRVSYHGLRHTHATIQLARGVPVEKVAQVLGHADPSVTYRVYFEYIQGGTVEAQEAAAENMTETLPQAPIHQFAPTGTEG